MMKRVTRATEYRLNIYRLLRLLLPTYFGYVILLILCASIFILSLLSLWAPVLCVGGVLLLYVVGVIGCKSLQTGTAKRLALLPNTNKKAKNGVHLDGALVESKVRFKTSDGKYSTTETADQYEAAMLIEDMLQCDPDAKYNLKKKIGTPFGRGTRYDWRPVCGNLPYD